MNGFRSIQSHVTLVFVTLILITILVMSVVAFNLYSRAAQENVQAYTIELVKQVNNNIESYIQNMSYISNLAADNRSIKEYLAKPAFDSLSEERKYKESISDFLESMLVSRNDIASVSIYGDGRFVTGNNLLELNPNVDIHTLGWYKAAIAADGGNVISPSHVQPIFKDRYDWVVSLSRSLVDDKGRSLGVFWVDLNFSVMNDMLKNINLGKRGYLFIVDQNGKYVYHPHQQLIYSNVKTEQIDKVLQIQNGTFVSDEEGDSRFYTVQDTGFGWKIVGVYYGNELIGNKNNVRLSFIILGFVCVVLAILVSLFLSRQVSRPIKQLQTFMKVVEKGNFDIQVPIPKSIEVGSLARAFNIMVGRIKELMAQVVTDQELKRTSELKALQAQINPHFLYNTLESIIWMAEANKTNEVVVMTSALGKLLRASISMGKELVSIGNEIEHITNYLKIQKFRYQKKLDYQITIDDNVRKYSIIKVVVQPIVENAIYHGIKNKRGPGLIIISSQETETDILIMVHDNGIGMDPERARQLPLLSKKEKEGRGVGVHNVHERLRLYYGNAYGLSFESTPGEGTLVTIRFPKSSLEEE